MGLNTHSNTAARFVHHFEPVTIEIRYVLKVFTLSFHRHGPGFFPGTGFSLAKSTLYLQTELNDWSQGLLLTVGEEKVCIVISMFHSTKALRMASTSVYSHKYSVPL